MAFAIGTEWEELGAYQTAVGAGLNIRDIHGQNTVLNEAYGRATTLRALWSDGAAYVVGIASGTIVAAIPVRLSRFSSNELEIVAIGSDVTVTASVTDGVNTATGAAVLVALGSAVTAITGTPLASDIDLRFAVTYTGTQVTSQICGVLLREKTATTSTIQ